MKRLLEQLQSRVSIEIFQGWDMQEKTMEGAGLNVVFREMDCYFKAAEWSS